MKRLATALFVSALLPSVGCIISRDSDNRDKGDFGVPDAGLAPVTGSLNVTWALEPGCPNGTDAAVVRTMEVTTQTMTADIFDCTAGAGTVSDLPAGTYLVWVDIEDQGQTTLLAQSLSVEDVSIVDFGDVLNVDIPQFPANEGAAPRGPRRG